MDKLVSAGLFFLNYTVELPFRELDHILQSFSAGVADGWDVFFYYNEVAGNSKSLVDLFYRCSMRWAAAGFVMVVVGV